MYSISIDYTQLKTLKIFTADLDKRYDNAIKKAVSITAEQAVVYAKKNTNVAKYNPYIYKGNIIKTGAVGGSLRNSWNRTKTLGQNGEYKADVFNPLEYAQYYEYGHRQTPGRYVPQIGKRLKSPFVKGRYPLKKAIDRVENIMGNIIEKELQKVVK